MGVVGFDFGNESGIVAVARQRGIDVVLNDESKRETPAIVCFGDKQRFIGTAGAATTMMNPKNSISQIKRLIGRRFSDSEIQRDIKALPFSVTEGPDGYPLINVRYLGESRSFTPTQVLGMVFSDLKVIAEKNLNTAVVDCCIGIPVYFTDLQRRAVLDAAAIAGLHPLRLFHETTATALAYGIYKTDLPENDQLNIAFVDIGHASMQVCIAGYKKGQLKVLAHGFDRSLGGRDFDEALFQHFVGKFKEEYKIDVLQNARACLRLRTACEKLKKMLSANPEAPLNIECLMEEKDVRGFIKREEFEQISIPILERVKRPLEKALSEAGLTVDDIHSVEVVGSGSQVPAIMKILIEFFGKEPRRTTNASECVARGCAIQCAILSPSFKVREFQVHESFPLSIALSWKGPSPDSNAAAANQQQSTVVFPKGNALPSVKALTFFRQGTFIIDVQYADAAELQVRTKISTYTIGPFQSKNGERSKLKVKARLNLHGIVYIDSATLLEEESDVPVSKEPAKVEAPKRKVKKTNVPVSELVHGGMLPLDVQKATEKEFEMALQDRVMKETKDKKNDAEAYVYDMRNKGKPSEESDGEEKREASPSRPAKGKPSGTEHDDQGRTKKLSKKPKGVPSGIVLPTFVVNRVPKKIASKKVVVTEPKEHTSVIPESSKEPSPIDSSVARTIVAEISPSSLKDTLATPTTQQTSSSSSPNFFDLCRTVGLATPVIGENPAFGDFFQLLAEDKHPSIDSDFNKTLSILSHPNYPFTENGDSDSCLTDQEHVGLMLLERNRQMNLFKLNLAKSKQVCELKGKLKDSQGELQRSQVEFQQSQVNLEHQKGKAADLETQLRDANSHIISLAKLLSSKEADFVKLKANLDEIVPSKLSCEQRIQELDRDLASEKESVQDKVNAACRAFAKKFAKDNGLDPPIFPGFADVEDSEEGSEEHENEESDSHSESDASEKPSSPPFSAA